MSSKEFARGAVFQRVEQGVMKLKEAAELLEMSYRQAKRMYKRYRTEGPVGLVHQSFGRRSNHARPAAERERVLELIREHYGGKKEPGPGQRFSPTLVAEHLWEDHGIRVPRSTVRGWMSDAGLWSRVRRPKPTTKRRERRRHFGELVQFDGSFHDWFEGRGERAGSHSCMMNMVDDATGRTLLRFGDQETTWAAADVLRDWIAEYGVPRALYTDWKNVYKRQPTSAEEAAGEEGHTQFGRMCAKLGIRIIGASTPQAKGRVERSNGTQQNRLIKKMRLKGIADDAAANAYMETYLPQYNAHFAVAPASTTDYHLPRNPELADRDVFCLEDIRVVSKDYVVQFKRQGLQLDRRARGRVPAESKVIVRQVREEPLRVIYVDRTGAERECHWTPAAPRATELNRAPVAALPKTPRKPHRPAANHPWRNSNEFRSNPHEIGAL